MITKAFQFKDLDAANKLLPERLHFTENPVPGDVFVAVLDSVSPDEANAVLNLKPETVEQTVSAFGNDEREEIREIVREVIAADAEAPEKEAPGNSGNTPVARRSTGQF